MRYVKQKDKKQQYSPEQQEKREKSDKFNRELNQAIDQLQSAYPEDWNFILTYIYNQATLKKLEADPQVDPDAKLARLAYSHSEMMKMYRRLARVEAGE